LKKKITVLPIGSFAAGVNPFLQALVRNLADYDLRYLRFNMCKENLVINRQSLWRRHVQEFSFSPENYVSGNFLADSNEEKRLLKELVRKTTYHNLAEEVLIVIGDDSAMRLAITLVDLNNPEIKVIAVPSHTDINFLDGQISLGLDSYNQNLINKIPVWLENLKARRSVGILQLPTDNDYSVAVVGLASDARYIILPQQDFAHPIDLKQLLEVLKSEYADDNQHALIVIGNKSWLPETYHQENALNPLRFENFLAGYIKKETNRNTLVIQPEKGFPERISVFDSLVGLRLGKMVAELIREDQSGLLTQIDPAGKVSVAEFKNLYMRDYKPDIAFELRQAVLERNSGKI